MGTLARTEVLTTLGLVFDFHIGHYVMKSAIRDHLSVVISM